MVSSTQISPMCESMVKYTEKSWGKISSLQRGSFSQKHKKVDSKFTSILFWNYWALNWVYCKSITKFQKLQNNKSRE
jgi:hypothetical protein